MAQSIRQSGPAESTFLGLYDEDGNTLIAKATLDSSTRVGEMFVALALLNPAGNAFVVPDGRYLSSLYIGAAGDFAAFDETLFIRTIYDFVTIAGDGEFKTESIQEAQPVDADAIAAAVVSSLNGSGARTVTITVDDGTDELQAATVRLTEGVNTFSQQTDATGQATFNVNDATHQVAITKAGFSFAGANLVVAADVQQSYSMTQTTVVPVPAAGQAVGQMLVVDETGEPESGVEINVQMLAVPTGTTGNAFDSKVWTQTSDAGGQVFFDGLIHGAIYHVWRGCSKQSKVEFEVPTETTFNLSDILG